MIYVQLNLMSYILVLRILHTEEMVDWGLTKKILTFSDKEIQHS